MTISSDTPRRAGSPAAVPRRRTAAGAARRLVRRAVVSPPEPVAPGVSVVRGGMIRGFNAYLITHDGATTVFDTGISPMLGGLRSAVAGLGQPHVRTVLSHAHIDHRGGARGLGAPVFCHARDVADAEGDAGVSYFDFALLPNRFAREVLPRMQGRFDDGGPVRIAGTLAEGDHVAGFEVVECPGHAPGHLALWRPHDGVLLAGDAFVTFDLATLRTCAPALPPAGFSFDQAQAARSLLRLADLSPSLACPGHGRPVTGDVRAQLRAAAAAR